MTIQTDLIQALADDIVGRLQTITELKDRVYYVYYADQISSVHQRMGLPAVILHYAGLRRSGSGGKHDAYFDVYLLANAESLSQAKNHPAKSKATELLQRVRKDLVCNVPQSNWGWVLENELPDFGQDDKLIYRQRWYTPVQIR